MNAQLLILCACCFIAGGCTFAIIGTAVRLTVRRQLWRAVGL